MKFNNQFRVAKIVLAIGRKIEYIFLRIYCTIEHSKNDYLLNYLDKELSAIFNNLVLLSQLFYDFDANCLGDPTTTFEP